MYWFKVSTSCSRTYKFKVYKSGRPLRLQDDLLCGHRLWSEVTVTSSVMFFSISQEFIMMTAFPHNVQRDKIIDNLMSEGWLRCNVLREHFAPPQTPNGFPRMGCFGFAVRGNADTSCVLIYVSTLSSRLPTCFQTFVHSVVAAFHHGLLCSPSVSSRMRSWSKSLLLKPSADNMPC